MSYFKNCVIGLAIMTGAGSLSAQVVKDTTNQIKQATEAEGSDGTRNSNVGQLLNKQQTLIQERRSNGERVDAMNKKAGDTNNPLPDGILPQAESGDETPHGLVLGNGNIHQISENDSNYTEIIESIKHTTSQISIVFNNMRKNRSYTDDKTGEIDISGVNIEVHIPTENTQTGYTTEGFIYMLKGGNRVYRITLPERTHFSNNHHKEQFKDTNRLLVKRASEILDEKEKAKLEQWSK